MMLFHEILSLFFYEIFINKYIILHNDNQQYTIIFNDGNSNFYLQRS